MSFLNAAIPNFKCFVRERFFYDGEPNADRHVRAVAFGIVSRPGHALGVHVLTERGVQWYGLPLHALSWKRDAPERELRDLESWDCFSFHVSVTEFPLLSGLRCSTHKGDKGDKGSCLFTIDWTHADQEVDPGWSRLPDEHKQGHFLKLDDGNFGLQPNNHLLWEELSLVTKPLAAAPTLVDVRRAIARVRELGGLGDAITSGRTLGTSSSTSFARSPSFSRERRRTECPSPGSTAFRSTSRVTSTRNGASARPR